MSTEVMVKPLQVTVSEIILPLTLVGALLASSITSATLHSPTVTAGPDKSFSLQNAQ